MNEAADGKYFIDGFLIKHFKIFPPEFDTGNLFYEQKVFLTYLMGNIPEMSDWKVQVDYKNELNNIVSNTEIELSKTDIDMAKLQGRDIEALKKERLESKKNQAIKELNIRFGLEEPKKEIKRPNGLPENDEKRTEIHPKKIWELLQGRSLKNAE